MKTVAVVVGAFGFAALSFALSGAILMWLWDWLLVGLFHWPVIDWGQGIGMAVLLAIVGGFFRSTSRGRS